MSTSVSEKSQLASPKGAVPSLDSVFSIITTWHIPMLVFAFLRGVPSSMTLMSVVFAAPPQGFHCESPSGWVADDGQCDMRQIVANHSESLNVSIAVDEVVEKCSKWSYDHSTYRGTTLVEEWDLVCGQKWMAASSQSAYILGLVFSTMIFSHVADWYGRKRACVISLLCSLVTGLIMAWAPSIGVYTVARFLAAVSASGYYDASTVLLVESVAADRRYLVTLTAGIGWSVGLILLPGLSYLLPNWRAQHAAIVVPLIVLLGLCFFIDESARWLLSAGRFEDAKKTLIRAIEKRPNVKCDDTKHKNLQADDIDRLIKDIRVRNSTIADRGKGTVADLFGRRYWRSTVVFCFTKMVAYMLWYHVTVSSLSVGNNPFLSFALASVCDLPNRALDALIVRVVPRRIAATSSFAFTTAAMALYYSLANGPWGLRLACLILCRLCTDVHGSVQRLQMAELYPSRLRSLAAGFVYTCANVSGLLAPFIQDLGDATVSWLPSLIIVACCLLASLATLTVKESFGKDLREDASVKDLRTQQECT